MNTDKDFLFAWGVSPTCHFTVMSDHDHDDDPVENNDNERLRSALSVLRNTRREEDDSRNTTTATNVQVRPLLGNNQYYN